MMKWRSNSFGGILLESVCGNIAVNGGGTLADMEDAPRTYLCTRVRNPRPRSR